MWDVDLKGIKNKTYFVSVFLKLTDTKVIFSDAIRIVRSLLLENLNLRREKVLVNLI